MATGKYGSQSLIPYLDHDHARYHLEISLRSEDPLVFEKGVNPFLIISESGPLARIIQGRVVTNAGSEIKRVFLVVQRDEYHFGKDEFWPVYNPDIDQSWQKAFLLHSGKARDDAMLLLSDQLNHEGGLSSFLSLFFCKRRQSFFHPLCPRCGATIHQCYDDELLNGLGLPPYATSTRRFLFCPSCLVTEGGSDFYTVSLESGDPPLIKDRPDLIKGFGRITEDRNSLRRFPCLGCPSHEECYGAEDLANSRIVPFSFYPFYMFILEAMSLNACDFLYLISGATVEDIEAHLAERQELGRLSCLEELKRKRPKRNYFFFDRDDRYFLEVLYLKISFLKELAQTVFPGLEDFKYPDVGISIDRLWVKLADQGGLMPFFWDFEVRFVDILGNTARRPSFPKMAPSYGLYFLGLVWFFTLLTNKKQELSDVYDVVGQAMEEGASGSDADLNSLLRNQGQPVFSPDNIFWDPDTGKGRPFNNTWKGLWDASLGLGWSLLQAGLRGGIEWSKEKFLEDLDNISEKIKDHLFPKRALLEQAEPVQENTAIHAILSAIMERWRKGLEPKQDDVDKTVVLSTSSDPGALPSDQALRYEEDVQQTVILSSDRFVDETMPPMREEDGLAETVMMSPMAGDGPVHQDEAPQDEDDMQQTVILTPDGLIKEMAPGVQEEDGLAETVIMSPMFGDGPVHSDEGAQDDGLQETIILSPSRPGQYDRKIPDVQKAVIESEEDESLAETVILRPGGAGKKK